MGPLLRVLHSFLPAYIKTGDVLLCFNLLSSQRTLVDRPDAIGRKRQTKSKAPSRNQKTALNQKLRNRLNQSGFCVCNLHQRHINTAPEKPHWHA